MSVSGQWERLRRRIPGCSRPGPGAGRGVLLIVVLGWVMVGGAGCASSEQDTVSERPWNAPKGWEHGLPPQLYDRDR